jgi:hypothetical protein
MTISEILAAGGANLFRGLSPGQRVGNAGRTFCGRTALTWSILGSSKTHAYQKMFGSSFEQICSIPSTLAISAFQMAQKIQEPIS